ncbi:MAG: YihY/virulence factor BrkB family protein, partial [Opitutaceae bacterium]|nr:YihY/virulence factor BrkB family protein [Cytophagales bacterium]
GGDTAKDIEAMIATAGNNKGTVISSILGIASMIFGATGVFYQLQKILNEMWGVRPKPKQAILKMIKDRVFSFGLILVIGFLLLVSLVLSAGMSALSGWVSRHISESLVFIFGIFDIVISIGVITVLFGALYKFLPDAKVKWRDVWVGSFLTSVLFVIAKFALGVYFGKSDPGSTYGAAGTIILIMLWVSYAGLILLFGAEFTQVYADKYGTKVMPTKGAEFIDAQKTEETRQDRKENISAEGNKTADPNEKDKKETWKM